MNDEQVLQFIPKLGVFGAQRLDQIDELFPNIFELLFDQKAPVEHRSTQIRYAGSLRRIRILAAQDRDGEHIRALARIAEIHERRITDLEGGEDNG